MSQLMYKEVEGLVLSLPPHSFVKFKSAKRQIRQKAFKGEAEWPSG